LSYLDKNNVEKAIITTVNRAASSKIYANDDVSDKSGVTENDPVKKAFENLRRLMPEDQLDHQDVIDNKKNAIIRFWKVTLI